MSDDEVPLYPDVPTTGAIVRTAKGAQALARRIVGDDPNRCRFYCVSCGWDNTYEFTEDEIEALGGDVTTYAQLNKCPGCDAMTMVPHSSLLGDDFKPVRQRAKESRREEYSEAADVLIDKVKAEVGGIMGGSTFTKPPEEQPPPFGEPPRDDLPDAGDISGDDIKPRGVE